MIKIFCKSRTFIFLKVFAEKEGIGRNISFVGILRSLAVIQVSLEKIIFAVKKVEDALGASKESNLSFVLKKKCFTFL
jgi:hypothetical protein